MLITLKNGLFAAAAALVFVLGAMSCKSGVTEQQKLQSQIEAMHDSAMMNTDKMYSFKKALIVAKTTGMTDGKKLSATETAEVDATISSITKAELAMEDWMKAFAPPAADKADAQKITAYLTAELVKVRALDIQIKAALKSGEEMAKKYPTASKPDEGQKSTSTNSKKDTTSKAAAAHSHDHNAPANDPASANAAKTSEESKPEAKTVVKTETPPANAAPVVQQQQKINVKTGGGGVPPRKKAE